MSKVLRQEVEDSIPWNTNLEIETDLYLAT